MVDDVRDITETAESKEALDRARLARERREAEQRKRLDELRAHAAAAQAQREKRDEERRKRQAEQRAKDDDRRLQVEERKRAIWEASISRREALVQRERDRAERLERQRAARSAPRPAFAFGSSTPRLLEPLDSAGFFWAARRAASTTNVMFASAPLTRRASALQLDTSDTDNKDESERQPQPVMWSSVARRRTDLVPTIPLGRAPGRAHSMTRLDRLPTSRPIHSSSPSMHHLNRTQRTGETPPGSRPGSALSNNTAGVVRRATSAPRRPRPASIAGTGVNTPRGGGDTGGQSLATTPSVSRDSTVMGGGDVPRRAQTTPRRPRPQSMHATTTKATTPAPGEGKPPLHRKPKPSKEHDKTPRGKSLSASPGRTLSPSPRASKEPSVDKETHQKGIPPTAPPVDKSRVSAAEVTQKLEALQVNDTDQNLEDKEIENNESVLINNMETKTEIVITESVKLEEKTSEQKDIEVQKPEKERRDEREEKKEPSQDKTDDNEMTASMTARRITTEEEAKAALAERRRRAREELERQAELERQRLQREAEEEAERQRLEEERQRREEEEARELAQLQRQMEEEKLRKAIEAQQQLEREEAERKTREEAERQTRLREEEEKRKAAEEAEKLRREEAEKEEKERLARKQRVEAIMARTRLRKQAEEEKKSLEKPSQATSSSTESAEVQSAAPPAPAQEAAPSAAPAHPDNGNAVATADLLGSFDANMTVETKPEAEVSTQQATVNTEANAETVAATNNGNVTADLLGLSEQNNIEDKTEEQLTTKQTQVQQTIDNVSNDAPTLETNNGNLHIPTTNVGFISTNMSANLTANFLQTEIASNESQKEVPKILDDDFTTHNGHGTHSHPLTLQNAI
ncbi:hypothetical protein K1T71_012346 [Dendrolimus kikuchii]|uniref:Uncharacterized protein n=1 Tax=Dendrolimus kikuchii TaxID=765133 RepID=A0ACC1CLB4_9NEOP|nr:hypothetical protein K1T71_012346 [Dendrolimus kikuchii]